MISDFSKTIPVHLGSVPKEIIEEHYKHISKVPIYGATIKAFLESERGIILRVYSGDNIVKRMRTVVGHTDPKKAEKGTIRQRFSDDSMEIAWQEKRYLNNVIHASSSVEEAERELKLWRSYIMLG